MIILIFIGNFSPMELIDSRTPINDQFLEIIEFQLANGWTLLRPEEICALTDAPILTDSEYYDDLGAVAGAEKVWWYPNYAVSSEVEKLLADGCVLFPSGN